MPTPDRSIVAQIKRIDPKLEVRWVETQSGGRWAIYHDVEYGFDNIYEATKKQALELQAAYLDAGHVVPIDECEQAAFIALQNHKLVCYVTDDEGGYRSLDGRIVTKLQRMDHYRQNLGIQGWKDMLNAKAAFLRDQKERAKNDIWDTIRKDKVFQRQASDILWGLKPMRSVYLNWEETQYGTRPQRLDTAPDGSDLRPEAAAHHDGGGADGDGAPGTQGDAQPERTVPVQ